MSISEKLGKARKRVRSHGIWSMTRWALTSAIYYPVTRWLDDRFDRKYGTETGIGLATSAFAVDEGLRMHAVEYRASPASSFVRFLREQDLDYREYTFVDLGCGKGRTLLLASLHFPFRRIIGVEFEPTIFEVCRNNIELFGRRAKGACEPKVDCMSAGQFKFPNGNILLYLFNPFDERVMAEVAANLRESLAVMNRNVRVVYSHPNNDAPLLKIPGIRLLRAATFHDRHSFNGIGRVNVYDVSSPPRA